MKLNPSLERISLVVLLCAGAANAQPEPVAEWDFEGSGSELLDEGVSSKGPLNMTAVGSLTRSSDTPQSGKGLSFGGSSLRFPQSFAYSYVSPLGNTKVESSTITVELWFKPASLETDQFLLMYFPRGAARDGRGFGMYVLADGRLKCLWGNASGAWVAPVVPPGAAITAGAWHHLAISFDASIIRLFVDGYQVSHAATSGQIQYADRSGDGPDPKTLYLGTGHNSHNTHPTVLEDLYPQFAIREDSLLDRVRIHTSAMRGDSEDGSVAPLLDYWACEPHFTVSPTDASVCPGGEAVFAAAGKGGSGLVYKWQSVDEFNFVTDLVDGPLSGSSASVLGSDTGTLTISGCDALAASFRYRCRISNGCGEVASVQAACSLCGADFDCSGFVDLDDYVAFVHAFEEGTDDADFDDSGFVDTDDFTAFVLAFEAGC